jgi:hypothetical protein
MAIGSIVTITSRVGDTCASRTCPPFVTKLIFASAREFNEHREDIGMDEIRVIARAHWRGPEKRNSFETP